MVNKTALEELDAKVSLISEKYKALKEENQRLKEIEVRLRQEILKLKEEDELKDLELEEMALRIGKSIEWNSNVKKKSIPS